MQRATKDMERINGLIARKGIRPMTDRIAREVLVRTDFAEAHYMSMLAMLMGVVVAFTLLDPISLWSSIVGTVVILLALILNETAYSVERQRVTRQTVPALSKQVVVWFTATPIVIQLALADTHQHLPARGGRRYGHLGLVVRCPSAYRHTPLPLSATHRVLRQVLPAQYVCTARGSSLRSTLCLPIPTRLSGDQS